MTDQISDTPSPEKPPAPLAMTPREPRSFPVAAVAAAVFALAVLVPLLWWATREKPRPVTEPPTKEELAYLSQIGVSDLHLSAEQNLIGSDVVYVDGKITNNGSQTIRQLRLRTYFFDTMGQVVLREERDVVTAGDPPLKPGESRSFQLRYDNLPKSWNVQLPDFRLASIKLQ